MLAVIAGFLDLIPQVAATIAAVILVAIGLTVSTEAGIAMLVIQIVYQQVEPFAAVVKIVMREAGRPRRDRMQALREPAAESI